MSRRARRPGRRTEGGRTATRDRSGLAQRWSPQQISRHLGFPDDRAMWLCHQSIYRPRLPLCGSVGRALLVAAADGPRPSPARPRTRSSSSGPPKLRHRAVFSSSARTSSPRPACSSNVTRSLVRLLRLPQRDVDTQARLANCAGGSAARSPRARGTEVARRLTISATRGASVYFCEAARSHASEERNTPGTSGCVSVSHDHRLFD